MLTFPITRNYLQLDITYRFLLQNLPVGDHFFEPIEGDLDFVCPVIIRQAISQFNPI